MTDSSLNLENASAQSEPNKSFEPLQTYHLSHDLRGPLNSVLGFTELLLEGIEGPLSEIQLEDIAAIRQSAQNLLKLINMVVDLGKVNANQMSFNPTPTNLPETLDNFIATYLEIQKSSIECIADFPEAFPPVWVDARRIEPIVGVLDFSLSKKGVEKIHVSITHDEVEATVTVVVTGLVITPENLEVLFDQTVEVDHAGRSKLTEGGLFLPLAYQLAQKQAGQLWVESTGDIETTFRLKLPLYGPDSATKD